MLSNYTAKLNWQAGANDMVSLFWFLGDKTQDGPRRRRRARRSTSTARCGTRATQYPSQPPGFSKLEWNHIFGAKPRPQR